MRNLSGYATNRALALSLCKLEYRILRMCLRKCFLSFFILAQRLFVVPALSFFIAGLAYPQALPSKSQSTELLQKTIESQNLQSPGLPFHLVSHVRYDFGGQTSDGVYEILWAAPDRFRETFQLGKMAEIDVALGGKIYIYRNTPTLTPQFLFLRNFVHHPIFPYLGDKSTAHAVYSDSKGGETRNCIVPSENPSDRVCFDPSTNLVVSVNLRSPEPSKPYDLEEDDFVSLGGRRYPRQMIRRISGQTIEVKVDTLVAVATFGADVFVPPANSEERDWCPHPTLKPGHDFVTAAFPKTNPPRIFFPFYVRTGVTGHIERFISLNPSAPSIDRSVAKWIRDATFPVWVCGSRPIESEQIHMNEW